MRERGLKQLYPEYDFKDDQVAPHAGAWIETYTDPFLSYLRYVAPHAGAWIETWLPPPAIGRPPCRSPCGSVD